MLPKNDLKDLRVFAVVSAGTVALSRFGRKSAKSPIDFARNFCLDLTDVSLIQQCQSDFIE